MWKKCFSGRHFLTSDPFTLRHSRVPHTVSFLVLFFSFFSFLNATFLQLHLFLGLLNFESELILKCFSAFTVIRSKLSFNLICLSLVRSYNYRTNESFKLKKKTFQATKTNSKVGIFYIQGNCTEEYN